MRRIRLLLYSLVLLSTALLPPSVFVSASGQTHRPCPACQVLLGYSSAPASFFAPTVGTSAHTPDSIAPAVTSAINTTGSDLLIVVVGSTGTLGATTVTDSKSNTWTPLTTHTSNFRRVQIFYSKNPTVGSGHTFTATLSSAFISICVEGFSGSHLTSPFDQENGNSADSGTSLTTGSITPAQNDELVIAAMCSFGSGAPAIDSGFTVAQNVPTDGANYEQSGLAYKIQTGAAAVNPTWSNGASGLGTAIASFKQHP